ncbi:MAG: ROK family protein [Pyrinomonadaceae bacterium]
MGESLRDLSDQYIISVDIGGTNIKSGIMSASGELFSHAVHPTPAQEGGAAVLQELKRIIKAHLSEADQKGIAPKAIGVATAGWVDSDTGRVIYASDNLPGWTGTEIGDELRQAFDLPVAVENDANAMAIAEHFFGAAKGVDDFICVTLGTGIGCGVFLDGKLRRGAHYLAGEFGHIQLVPDGLPCTCGKRGCLEVYGNAAALLRYARDSFKSAKGVIEAANGLDRTAIRAIETLARHLAEGCAGPIGLLDPSLLLLSGGLTQNNPLLLASLKEELETRLLAKDVRKLRVEFSTQQYLGGISGAAAVAFEKLTQIGFQEN